MTTSSSMPADSIGPSSTFVNRLFERRGRTNLAVVIGGPDDWATGGPRLTTGT